MVCARICNQEDAEAFLVFMSRWLASFSLSLAVEPPEGAAESCDHADGALLYINQRRVAWFMDGGSEEKGQCSV